MNVTEAQHPVVGEYGNLIVDAHGVGVPLKGIESYKPHSVRRLG
jgi:hypothetical protein